eukprot:9480577-Pyramimonas_sp.AAC.3
MNPLKHACYLSGVLTEGAIAVVHEKDEADGDALRHGGQQVEEEVIHHGVGALHAAVHRAQHIAHLLAKVPVQRQAAVQSRPVQYNTVSTAQSVQHSQCSTVSTAQSVQHSASPATGCSPVPFSPVQYSQYSTVRTVRTAQSVHHSQYSTVRTAQSVQHSQYSTVSTAQSVQHIAHLLAQVPVQ